MTNSFAALKKTRTKSFDDLNNKLTEMNNGGYADPNADKYWQPTVDANGNGYAIIRFLPAPKDEDMPFVQLWSHGFQGPTGKWYIENCLSTIKKDDPVNEYNSRLWATGLDEDKKQVRRQKRKLSYIANIQVIEDPSNPDNNGRVALFKFGKKIYNKLNDLMNPEFADEPKINPFDFWEGANFRLKIRKVEGYRNYDKSEFDSSTTLSDDDSELEAIWNKQFPLKELVAESEFKSYAELEAKMNSVLGITNGHGTGNAMDRAEQDSGMADDEIDLSSMASNNTAESEPIKSVQADEDDPDLAFFRSINE